MSHIVLTEDQLRVLASAGGTIEAQDGEGRPVARVTLLGAEDLAAIERCNGRPLRMGPMIQAEQAQAK